MTHVTAAEWPDGAGYAAKNAGEAAHLNPSFDTWKFWLSSAAIFAGLLTIALLPSGCGNLFADNGTHLASALESGAAKLRASADSRLLVEYQTLDGGHDPYYIEVTPSFPADQPANVPNSYIVVSGKTRGGTSYHNRFVLVPQRLYIEKTAGGPTEILLQRAGDKVSVVALR